MKCLLKQVLTFQTTQPGSRTGVLFTGFGAILAKHEPKRNRCFETFENRTGVEPNGSKNIEPQPNLNLKNQTVRLPEHN